MNDSDAVRFFGFAGLFVGLWVGYSVGRVVGFWRAARIYRLLLLKERR